MAVAGVGEKDVWGGPGQDGYNDSVDNAIVDKGNFNFSRNSNVSPTWETGVGDDSPWHHNGPLLNPYIRTLFIALYSVVFIITVTG
jgi:hypothetical protein